MQETLDETADAGVFLSDSGCRSLSIRQRMLVTLLQTADVGDSIKQGMQETLSDSGCRKVYQTADAGDSLSDSGCRRLSIRQRMQITL